MPLLPAVDPAKPGPAPPEGSPPFPIVAIGASAGGLEALQELLAHLPCDTGMAFVLVPHLGEGETHLPEILGRCTAMPVRLAENREEIRPDRVYLIRPGCDMVYTAGRLELRRRVALRSAHRPIDQFMRSLAEEHGTRAIGVVLSGALSDGTLGLHEIKAAGGVTFAQDSSAQQSSMPRHAIAAGCVDMELPPKQIAEEIARISRHPFSGLLDATPEEAPVLPRIVELVRHAAGVDFSNYKHNTLRRRITRRMVLHRVETLSQYVELLQASPQEVLDLYQDILIHVTSFFRDPEAYDVIREAVFPQIAGAAPRHEVVRVWALGCSTGEEAYSIAMCYQEYMEAHGIHTPMQVFATDLNGAGIEKARAGIYPKGIVQDVAPDRLRRFFVEIDGSYQVSKSIRDMCVFARQNVLADPPFSRLDLIACRNMLIYMEPVLQQRLMTLLHYSLRPGGYLWLGSAETIGGQRELFEAIDPRHKVFRRKEGRARYRVGPLNRPEARPGAGAGSSAPGINADPNREADRLLLTRYAPPAVLLDPELNILQFRGDTSPFLAPAAGKASLNLLKMLREGLSVGVRGAVHRAKRDRITTRVDGLRVKGPGGRRIVNVVVVPLSNGAAGSALVIFEDAGEGDRARVVDRELERAGPATRTDASDEVERLQHELQAMREYLQAVIEEQEAANEELQSATEEMQSTNEELQSINAELETSKEEIQSSNKELATVNNELQDRNLELSRTNDDLLNLLASVQIPIVMLGADFRIRRFTPAAEKVLNLVPTDVGRSVSDIKLDVDVPDLERILSQVVGESGSFEREVQDRQGRWHSLRIRQYRTADNRIDGAVLMLVDIDSAKRAARELAESEARFARMADSAPVLLWVSSGEGLEFANRACQDFLGQGCEALRGRPWSDFVLPHDRPGFIRACERAARQDEPLTVVARMVRQDRSVRWMRILASPRMDGGELKGYVGTALDITELHEAEHAKNDFFAVLAQELRAPLAAMSEAHRELAGNAGGPVLEQLASQSHHLGRLADNLMEASRLGQGRVELHFEAVDLGAVARSAAEELASVFAASRQGFELALPGEAVWITADAQRLRQVVVNLLRNAAAYTPHGGRVWLSVEKAEPDSRLEAPHGVALLRVRDNGVGIVPSQAGRVFEPFLHGERIAREKPGAGIGLTICKRVVELHEGSIEARSEGPWLGSEFVVRLPLRGPARPA